MVVLVLSQSELINYRFILIKKLVCCNNYAFSSEMVKNGTGYDRML